MLVEEATEVARHLHSYYLVEAEPGGTSPSWQSDGPTGVKGSSGFSASARGLAFGVAAGAETKPEFANGSGQPVNAATAAPGKCRNPLRSLAFPSPCLPANCKLLLEQYPCLRSPAVVARMLQGCDISRMPAERFSGTLDVPPDLDEKGFDGVTPVFGVCSSATPRLKGVSIGQTHQTLSAPADDAFGSTICLHFRGLKALAAQLSGCGSPVDGLGMTEPEGRGSNWRDVGGRIAVTEVGGAAVEAGIAPWEAAELFADIFKTSVLG